VKFSPQGLPTSIGSLPHLDEKKAVEFVLKNFSQIPSWPQLPKRDFHEDMRIQFSEGLPGVVCDPDSQKFYFDTGEKLEKNLEEFYQQYLSGNLDYFAISKPYAAGFYSFLETLQESPLRDLMYLKGQITGPISAGLSTTDEKRRAVIYREEFVDVLSKQAAMKAKWQIRELKKVFPKVIIFIDEPYLASVGSAYINLDKDTLINNLQEVITAIQEDEALAGIHCCGNTDWSLPLSTTLDILSFDAFEFAENLALYGDKIKEFLGSDGILAWGIVPSQEVDDETLKPELLFKKLENGFKLLVKKGIDLDILKQSCLITPSCGTGSLKLSTSVKILEATRILSEKFREQ